MFQIKDKSPETDPKETEINDLPDREFKIKIINILTDVGRAMYEQSENFNKKLEDIKEYQTEIMTLKNKLTDLKKVNRGIQ